MKLYLVQHGEAHPKTVDPERPLTERGREDAERMAEFLGRAGIQVERVMHSGKLRAAQTADLLAQTVAPFVELEVLDGIRPDDDPAAIDWDEATGGQDTLVAGHLPFMERLVSLLIATDAQRPVVAYERGSVVCLERDAGGQWRIDWMIRPELLRRG